MEKFDKEKLSNILIQFRIPFSIDVLNSINETDEGLPYTVWINEIPGEFRFERIYDFRYKDEGADMGQYSRMDEDRSGILSHHRVQIIFDTRILSKVEINPDMILFSSELFLEKSLEYLNKFLMAYRDVSQQYWINFITKRHIFSYHYVLFDSNGNTTSSMTLIPQHNPVQFNGNKEYALENEKDEKLRQMIQTNYFSFRNELILNTDDNFSLGNYNIALLQAVIRFENFVYTSLIKKLSKTKFNKLKKKDCGCIAGINEICTNGFKVLFNIDFENTEEYKNLKQYAITYRNKIAHGEKIEDIGQELAVKGINAVGYAEKYLIENIFTELLTTYSNK